MAHDPWLGELPPRAGPAIIRVDTGRWAVVQAEVFDFSERERAGVLLTRAARSDDGAVLAVVGWMPVPDEYVIDTAHGLAYDGRFNLRVAEAAESLDAGAVLVHAHPGKAVPQPSSTDAERGAAFLAFMRRRRPEATHGLIVIADDTVTGVIDEPTAVRDVERLVSVGLPIREWLREAPPPARR